MSSQADKTAQVKNLSNGKGIQYLLNEAAIILGNPLLMHDVDYKLIAHTENVVTDDYLWNELATTGEHSRETQEFFRNECLIDYVANAKDITLLSSPNIKYDRLFGKIFNKNKIMVACLDCVCCFKPFEKGDKAAFSAVRKLLSKEINTSEYYQNYGQMYHETLVKKLINEEIEDRRLFSCHIANLYHGLQDMLFLAVAKNSNTEYAALASIRDSVTIKNPAFKCTVYKNHLVIIISTENTPLDLEKDLYSLNPILENHGYFAGISGPFENLYELQKYYTDAVNILNAGLQSGSGQHIFIASK